MTVIDKVKIDNLASDQAQQKLIEYSKEVKSIIKSTLMSAVRIGEILKDVKDNILPYGEWLDWVATEFEGSIHPDTATNFINLSDLYSTYSKTHRKGLENLSLSSLYIISRSNVNPEVKEAVLELAEEEESMSREDVRDIVKSFRRIKAVEAGLPTEVQQGLVELEIAEDPKEIKSLQKLSKRKQLEVVERISGGEATTTKEAIKQINEERKSKNREQETIEVSYTQIQEIKCSTFHEVPNESVNVAFIEAPLKLHYVESRLHDLAVELDRILAPGGYAIITIGHKGAMFCGEHLQPLKPVHLLCLRRQPGNSRSIIGTNITSASVFAAFCYKAPYRAPREMLVDLHTYNEITDTEALVGLDEIPVGLEKCIERILTPLLHSGETLLHATVGGLHFHIAEFIKGVAVNLNAATLYKIRA